MNRPEKLSQQEVHISDYINILLRRRNVFFKGFFAAFIGVVLYTFLMEPVYEASSTVYVKDDKSKLGMTEMLSMGSPASAQSEIEILKSRSIAEEVVKELHMDWKIVSSSSSASFKVLNLGSSSNRGSYSAYSLTMTGPDSFVVKDSDDKVLGNGKCGVPCQLAGLDLQIQLYGKKGDSFKLTRQNFNKAVAGVRGATTVKEVARMTNVIQIAYKNNDPVLSRNVVNTLVQAYLNKSLLFKTQEASRSVSFIETQLQGVRDDLNKAETKLQEYKSSSGVVQLDAEAKELISSFAQLEKERFGISLQKKQLEFALASQKENLSQGGSYSPAVMKDDPLVAQMASQLAQLEVQKRSLLVSYTKNHPAVETLQSQINELQQKIRATYDTGVKNLSKQELDVSRRLEKQEDALRRIPATERDLARYTRLAKVSADIYTFLLQKHEEARIAKASTISNINVIDTAITPDAPIRPEKKKYLLIGLLVSLIAGAVLTFFLEYLDDSIKNEMSAKNILGVTHLATIPHLGTEEKEKLGEIGSLANLTHTDPRSAAAEAFRALRTGIHFSSINKQKQVIMLTSSFPGEGKSTISSNLAITIAQTGVRTLLIDCDMHKPKQYKWLNIPRSPGVSEVLSSDIDLAKTIYETGVPNLSFMPAGNTPPNPSILMGSQAMRDLVERLRGI